MTSPPPAAEAWALVQRFVEAQDRRSELASALGFRLGGGRGKVLFLLREGSLTLREIAAQNGMDAPYATLIVDKLEALGLVTRETHPVDRRRKLVSLTAAGVSAVELADSIWSRPPSSFASLSAGELASLTAVFSKLQGV